MSETQTLFLYTIDFPYGDTEPYLNNELPYLSAQFDNVIIIAENKVNNEFKLPDNVDVYFLREINLSSSKRRIILINTFTLFQILLSEFFHCDQKMFFLKRLKLTVSELFQSLLVSEKIKMISRKTSGLHLHYSFWMNAFPLALSILKKKQNIHSFVFRVHGFDLYKERWVKGFIPYRYINYKFASAVYVVSMVGLKYIRSNFSYFEKAECSYLGTKEWGNNEFNKEEFVIVTCSSIIPLKRLGLLADALQYIDFPVKWFHFGDGKETEKALLHNQVANLPEHISVVFKGLVTQDVLFEFYRTQPVSVFINVSETEGLPVSIMEAISFGIPIIATDVGGTSEIVNSHSGVLINKNCTPKELAKEIEKFKNGFFNMGESRKKVKEFWKTKFSAEHNYPIFCKQLKTHF